MKPFTPVLTTVVAIACFVATGTAASKEKGPRGNPGNGHKEKQHPHQPPKSHPVRLGAPTQLQAVAISDSQVRLVWCDKSSNEQGFAIERAGSHGKYERIASAPPNATAYLDTSLKADTRYCYRVRAFNTAGRSDYSNRGCTTTGRTTTNCAVVVNSWGSSSPTTVPAGLSGVVAVASGDDQGLALKKDGSVVAWSYRSPARTPFPPILTNVIAIAAGAGHGVALKKNGTVVTWQPDIDFLRNKPQPRNLNCVTAVAAGAYHTLALKQDGSVVGWGDDYYGAATPPPGLSGVKCLAAGENFSLALQTNGTLVSWGLAPLDAPSRITNAVALAAGQSHGLALLRDGTVVGWQTDTANNAGVPPAGLSNVVAISAARNTSLALKRDGTVVGWGDPFGRSAPPGNLAGVTAIAAGGSSHLAVSTTPNPPLNFAAQIVATNQVRLVWTPNSFEPSLVQIERAPGDLDPAVATNWTQIASIAPGVASYDDTPVLSGSNYWYRAGSANACGQSIYTPPTYIDIQAPGSPPFLDANALADNVRLAVSTPYSGILGLRIERAPDVNGSPGVWRQILATNSTDAISHAFIDSRLTLSNRYWYRAQFFNGLGDSPFSSPTSVTILPPAAPPFINAFILRSNRIFLSWSAPFSNDQDGYKLERTTNVINGSESWKQIAIVSNTPYPYFVDAAIKPGATNSYRIRCFNKLGHSPYSSPLSVEIVSPPAPDLSGYAFADQARISWYLNYSGQLESFRLQRALDNGGVPGDWSKLAAITNYGPYSYTDAGLSPGATYWYRVQVINWTGSSQFSLPVAVTIVPPATPFDLNAVASGTNAIQLAWTSGFPSDQHGFTVERSTDDLSFWTEIATVPATNRYRVHYSDSGFIANLTNYYRVRAFNTVGLSGYSDVVGGIVKLPTDLLSDKADFPLMATLELTNNDVLITWNAPAGSSVVETSSDLEGPFSSIPESLITGNAPALGTYLDPGARTNAAARFYRIRVTR